MSLLGAVLEKHHNKVNDWQDISEILSTLENTQLPYGKLSESEFNELISKGAAFVTYDFGIDGVSIEIFKYADCLEHMFPQIPLHFIAGDFHDKADIVLKDYWKRYHIPGINGWDKWLGGEYFSKLYYEDMPEGSDVSREMAKEMWKQACGFAKELGDYLEKNDIHLIIPVNIPSNPGNFAIELALILVSEVLGTYVISSNHDYYWEGGKPAAEHQPGEEPGPRDHFFRNMGNKPFFELFKRMYPWNGRRWILVNINTPQTEALTSTFGFAPEKVFELGTSIGDSFFIHSSKNHVASVRSRMNYIISDGNPVIEPLDVRDHLANLDTWMQDEKPVACANRAGLTLDLAKPETHYCLQPTRVILRKHIEKDLELLQALLRYKPFADKFIGNPGQQLVLHITGPTPIEHKEDLENVLKAYIALCESVPPEVADRVFVVFSVGNETHPCFEELGLEPLCIEEIYQLADVILFPSETEGRGLPIIESSAGGIPIVCRRYYPEEVFSEVIGEDLPEKEQIEYLLFPVDGFDDEFLHAVADMLLKPEKFEDWREHNRKAVRHRYSTKMIIRKFKTFFETLRKMG
jgi:glycosyltransferase involved in cell wall biosynthesis